MSHQYWGGVALATALAVVAVACAPGTEDLPQGGSQLEPTFRPVPEKAARKQSQQGDRERPQPASGSDGTRSAKPGQDPSASPPATTAPGAPASSSPSPATTASVSDPGGDVSGLGDSPAYVDLAGATLARDGQRYRLVVETGGTLPQRQEGDRTTNIVGFVDHDLDGVVDYEVWATLADDGWGSSSRHPDGARFGEESGVEVTVAGSTLTMVFAAAVIGGKDSFQWSVASEHGTLQQVASGTTAQDHAPDRGAVPYPG